MGVLLALYSQTLFGRPSSSQVSSKKVQSRPRRRSKYFALTQREGLFGCLRRAHCHRLEDGVINASKCAFTHHVPMIVRPTANLRVELIDQIGGRRAVCVFDDSSDAVQEGSNILLGRLDEQFPLRVSAHVLSEEIKAALHVRDDGLRWRKFKPSFLHELLDEGFDFSFQ